MPTNQGSRTQTTAGGRRTTTRRTHPSPSNLPSVMARHVVLLEQNGNRDEHHAGADVNLERGLVDAANHARTLPTTRSTTLPAVHPSSLCTTTVADVEAHATTTGETIRLDDGAILSIRSASSVLDDRGGNVVGAASAVAGATTKARTPAHGNRLDVPEYF